MSKKNFPRHDVTVPYAMFALSGVGMSLCLCQVESPLHERMCLVCWADIMARILEFVLPFVRCNTLTVSPKRLLFIYYHDHRNRQRHRHRHSDRQCHRRHRHRYLHHRPLPNSDLLHRRNFMIILNLSSKNHWSSLPVSLSRVLRAVGTSLHHLVPRHLWVTWSKPEQSHLIEACSLMTPTTDDNARDGRRFFRPNPETFQRDFIRFIYSYKWRYFMNCVYMLLLV